MSHKTNLDSFVRNRERFRRISLGLPVPIVRAEIPLGYVVNPKNDAEAIADENVFKLLVAARKHLKESPYAEVAAWLTRNGVAISHNGLHKIMQFRPPYTDEERALYGTDTRS
jgi:hypothetical protein